MPSEQEATITVLDVTYIATEEGKPAEFIGLWYHDSHKCQLVMFSLDRKDILVIEQGDQGTLRKTGASWEFVPRLN